MNLSLFHAVQYTAMRPFVCFRRGYTVPCQRAPPTIISYTISTTDAFFLALYFCETWSLQEDMWRLCQFGSRRYRLDIYFLLNILCLKVPYSQFYASHYRTLYSVVVLYIHLSPYRLLSLPWLRLGWRHNFNTHASVLLAFDVYYPPWKSLFTVGVSFGRCEPVDRSYVKTHTYLHHDETLYTIIL
jgi:hypothetical protein